MPAFDIYWQPRDFVRKVIAKLPRASYKMGSRRYNRMSCGFDIETTRIKQHAFMWCWQFGCNGSVLIGRTWQQYASFVQSVNRWLDLFDQYCIVWVANLGHEHSFLGRRFDWSKIFAVDAHKPLIARSERIEYRECLTISGQGGLENLAKNYTTTKKMVGDLDYTIIRNSQTEIDQGKELGYICNDVRILCEWNDYILRQYVDKGFRIPLTATGIPRAAVKAAAYRTGRIKEIKAVTKHCYPSRAQYNFIMRYLFRGGYTHGNVYNLYLINDDVIGSDYKSSYPAVMEHDYYPCSRFIETLLECDGERVTDLRLRSKCCWMIVEIEGIEKRTMHTVESEHKIIKYEGALFDNGRLSKADRIKVALTELDYDVYEMFYKWDHIKVIKSFVAVRGRLPRYVLEPMEMFYRIKEDLKKQGKDKTPEYQNAKAGLNSFYGLMVQRLNFESWEFADGVWTPHPKRKTYKQMIADQILNPYWGIWITAHARHNILSVIHELDPDMEQNSVIYSDTDSVYFTDTEHNRRIIQSWNERMMSLNVTMKLPNYMSKIGCFDWIDEDEKGEPIRYRFKTLGAKRYIKVYEINGCTECEVTVAGMRKGSLQQKIGRQFAAEDAFLYQPDKHSDRRLWISESELFDSFEPYLLLDMTESLKSTTAYDPEPYSEIVTDAAGHKEEMHEESGVAIVPIPFKIKMDWIYLSLIYSELKRRRHPIAN